MESKNYRGQWGLSIEEAMLVLLYRKLPPEMKDHLTRTLEIELFCTIPQDYPRALNSKEAAPGATDAAPTKDEVDYLRKTGAGIDKS